MKQIENHDQFKPLTLGVILVTGHR